MVLGAIALVLLTAVVALVGATRWLRGHLEEQFVEELTREVRLVASVISSRPTDLNVHAHRLGVLTQRRVTIIDDRGVVVGDSDFNDASLTLLDNHADRPEVRAARQGGVGVDRRRSVSTNRIELKVAIQSWPGAVRISAPIDQIDLVVGGATRIVIAAAVVASLVGIVLAILGGRAFARPVETLAGTARAVVKGEGDLVYPDTRVPELQRLVHAIRAMREHLAGRMTDLQRERRETRTILDSMTQGVLAADPTGSVVHSNAAARTILGLGVTDPIPPVGELFHERDARHVVDAVMRGEVVEGHEVDLRGRAVLLVANPLPGGGAVLALLDVTEARRIHTMRRDFVANISHELKTPLTSIRGYSETLLAGDVDPDLAERFLETIGHNARRMQRLVDELLDLARVESGAWVPHLEAQELAPRVREAWRALSDRPGGAEVTLVVDVPNDFVLTADGEAVQTILTNLLSNAVRHAAPEGTVTVSGAHDGPWTIVAVTDTGTGIPVEHQSRIFERFYRVDPGRSRDEGGTGLGLSIVKHLVEVHGGDVALESVVGQGTTIRMRFPYREPAIA